MPSQSIILNNSSNKNLALDDDNEKGNNVRRSFPDSSNKMCPNNISKVEYSQTSKEESKEEDSSRIFMIHGRKNCDSEKI